MGRRRLVVLRPAPGNAATLAAARAAGWEASALPLFRVRPLAWAAPDPAGFDALLLTSANAARHAGPGLARLAGLPVLAVGAATAAAAAAAGLAVTVTGDADGAALAAAARARGWRRLLHLAGRDRADLGPGVAALALYASEPLAPPADAAARLAGATVLVHSGRAARALAALPLERGGIALAAISPAALAAAGPGWRVAAAAAAPTDAALLAAAAALG